MQEFILYYQRDNQKIEIGKLSFNDKFIFQLQDTIPIELWDRIGIIPVNPETKRLESEELFSYLNSRLPIKLRNASKEEKIEYIKKSGLRVPSDNFYFESVKIKC